MGFNSHRFRFHLMGTRSRQEIPKETSTSGTWRRNTGSIRILASNITLGVCFSSPDAATVVAGTNDGEVRLWEVASGATIRDLEGLSGRVLTMSFSQDGATLATASHEGIRQGNLYNTITRINRWNVAAGTKIATWEGDYVDRLAFSPDRTMFATGSQDKLVRLYDLSTGENIATFEGHNHYVVSVSFTDDSKTLASGSLDGTILLWDLAPYRVSHTPDPDFNGDGAVDFADFVHFASRFGSSLGDLGYDSRYDLDGDGEVGFSDFLIFVREFAQ